MSIEPLNCLIVAKAPVAGLAKTRLGAATGDDAAADLAAAALLDTLDVCSEVFAPRNRFLALDGDLRAAVRRSDIESRMESWTVFPQRGADFAARLVSAHAEVGQRTPGAILQLGMDTPQVHASLLQDVGACLDTGDAVLGPAIDGGWWVLALRDPTHAKVLAGIPTSSRRTGELTREALRDAGLRVAMAPVLHDVDTVMDAQVVAAAAPHTRFAAAWRHHCGGQA